MSDRRLLIAYAHPDDESFGLGGLIARYVAEGTQVYLICATNGDVGTVSPEMLNGYASIAELRLAELHCASQKLGLAQVFTFGYKDSGMMGQDSNHHPESLWHCWQHTPEHILKRVVEVIRQIKPQVIITFNKYGGYGHPDHIAIQQATTRAFHLAADETYIIEGTMPYQSQKLYYSSIPAFFVKMGIRLAHLQGKDPRKLGTNHDIDLQAVLEHVEPEHAQIDIGDFIQDWDEASACHASQGGGSMMLRFPRWFRRMLSPRQGFTRIQPQPKTDEVDEYDLFQGIDLS